MVQLSSPLIAVVVHGMANQPPTLNFIFQTFILPKHSNFPRLFDCGRRTWTCNSASKPPTHLSRNFTPSCCFNFKKHSTFFFVVWDPLPVFNPGSKQYLLFFKPVQPKLFKIILDFFNFLFLRTVICCSLCYLFLKCFVLNNGMLRPSLGGEAVIFISLQYFILPYLTYCPACNPSCRALSQVWQNKVLQRNENYCPDTNEWLILFCQPKANSSQTRTCLVGTFLSEVNIFSFFSNVKPSFHCCLVKFMQYNLNEKFALVYFIQLCMFWGKSTCK